MIVGVLLYVLYYSVFLSAVGANLEPFVLDDYVSGTFSPRSWNGTWVTDTVYVYKGLLNDYYKVDVEKGDINLIVTKQELKRYKRSQVTPSEDLKYFLIKYNTKRIFRYSSLSQYAIYDIENKKHYDLHDQEPLQLMQWIPKRNGLIYVHLNNIYYVPTIEDILHPKQITKDGVRGMVFNGIPDWVYEEEVLSSASALWFSPTGDGLVFARFDDEEVQDYNYLIYGQPGNLTSQYPSIASIKYPKAGTPNPKVSIHYVNLNDPSLEIIALNIVPIDSVGSEHIIADVTWANNVTVVAVSLNRVQNKAAVVECNVELSYCFNMNTYEQSKGWLDIKAPRFIENGKRSFIISAELEDGDPYKHLSLVRENDVLSRRRLTFGKRVILSIYGIDEKNSVVYYLSTVPDQPYQEQVYVYNYKTNTEYCVSCGFMVPEGECAVSSAAFSKQYSYIARTCLGPGPKVVQVQNIKTGKFFTWEANTNVRNQLLKKLKPVEKTLKVPIKNNLFATVRLLLPPGLDELSNKKYPMIVNVYGGPNSNRVTNRYSAGVENYFVTNRNYIYAYIDGRGSGRHGNRMLFAIYRKFGTVEIEDQIEVTKYLQSTYSYIDQKNTAIWGWSYGGFATLQALIQDTENVFKVGIAVAPVTSFLYYDSIYTERYMGMPTPDDNLEGYKNADILAQIDGLQNKTFFIIHGNADDNVHYQQSMLLAKWLQRFDIMFYQQSYPDENHNLGRVTPHLYHTIDDFFYRNLKTRKHLKNKKVVLRRNIDFSSHFE